MGRGAGAGVGMRRTAEVGTAPEDTVPTAPAASDLRSGGRGRSRGLAPARQEEGGRERGGGSGAPVGEGPWQLFIYLFIPWRSGVSDLHWGKGGRPGRVRGDRGPGGRGRTPRSTGPSAPLDGSKGFLVSRPSISPRWSFDPPDLFSPKKDVCPGLAPIWLAHRHPRLRLWTEAPLAASLKSSWNRGRRLRQGDLAPFSGRPRRKNPWEDRAPVTGR